MSWSKALQQVTLLHVILPVILLPVFLLSFPIPDGPDPPSDLASVPALSLPTPEGPALSDPTPDGSPPSPDDYFLPPPGWLESPDPSLQIVADSASPISVLAAFRIFNTHTNMGLNWGSTSF